MLPSQRDIHSFSGGYITPLRPTHRKPRYFWPIFLESKNSRFRRNLWETLNWDQRSCSAFFWASRFWAFISRNLPSRDLWNCSMEATICFSTVPETVDKAPPISVTRASTPSNRSWTVFCALTFSFSTLSRRFSIAWNLAWVDSSMTVCIVGGRAGKTGPLEDSVHGSYPMF